MAYIKHSVLRLLGLYTSELTEIAGLKFGGPKTINGWFEFVGLEFDGPQFSDNLYQLITYVMRQWIRKYTLNWTKLSRPCSGAAIG
jgi:hypothetical protein